MKKHLIFLVLAMVSLSGTAQDLPTLYKSVQSSVVVIETLSKKSAGKGDKVKVDRDGSIGSGVLISDDGYIWTASHVVHSADLVAVTFLDGDSYEGTVISSNPVADVALLKIDDSFQLKKKHVAKIGDSDKLEIGQDIFVIGAPHGIAQSLSRGIVSGRKASDPNISSFSSTEYIQTDASINPGNSGGPIFNMKGEVVAIASYILSKSGGFEGISYGATSKIANKILMEEKPMWSGLEYVFLENELAAAFNIPQTGGVLITNVASEGIGKELGLKGGYIKASIEGVDLLMGGDVLLEVAGLPLTSAKSVLQLRKLLLTLETGDKYVVKYLRDGKIESVTTESK